MADDTLPVGTVTFVFTDIEGSTLLTRRLGDKVAAVLDDHHRLLRSTVADADGIVVSTEGDGLFCVFASATRAVAAAADAQQRLSAHRWPGGVDVRVRMGVHTGEAVLGGDNYVGLDVHRASRIASAGHGGQVLLSGRTAALVADDLPPTLALRDLGDHELRGLGMAERLFQLVVADLESRFPPVRSLRATASRLPATLTSFFGRHDEIAAVRRFTASPGLVTLLGPGGVGKTRLAIEAARSCSEEVDGLCFVDLNATSNPELLASFVASAMSIVDSASIPAQELVSSYVGSSRYLLVVDSCDHVIDAAGALVRHLVESCPRLTVLATSREPLGVPGEQLIPLSGLDPVDGRDDAEQLFAQRALAVAPAFDPDRWSSEISELCRRLDGLPLAIELAAARAGALTPRDILDRLDDRFGLLRSGASTGVARHQSLEATVSWSYETLQPAEQSLLRALSVFRGGATLQAVERVCGEPAAAGSVTLDTLSSLVAKSFVRFHTDGPSARYDLLETIRAYAAVQLEEAGETGTTLARHRDHYLEWARIQAQRLSTSDQLAALDELEADHANLMAVIERGVAREDREPALRMAATLVWFWYVHSHFTEGAYWSGRLLADRDGVPTRPLIRLLIGAGEFDFRLGEHDRARARFTEALGAARAIGSDSLAMWALAYAATNDTLTLRLDDASSALDEAARIADERGDFLAAGYCAFMDTSIRGWIAVQDDDVALLPPLLEKLETLAALTRAAGERNMIGHVMQAVGLMAHWLGRPDQAYAALEESIVAFSEIETVACASHALEAVALTVAHAHPDATVELLAGSQALRERIGVKTPPLEQHLRRLAADDAAARLSPEGLRAARDRGGHLTLAEATALAREVLASGRR